MSAPCLICMAAIKVSGNLGSKRTIMLLQFLAVWSWWTVHVRTRLDDCVQRVQFKPKMQHFLASLDRHALWHYEALEPALCHLILQCNNVYKVYIA